MKKITKTMALANAKYNWHRDTTSNEFTIEYYKFSTLTLGMCNIDRIFKSKEKMENLMVINEEKREMKLLFKDAFVLLNGKNIGNKTEFKNIPSNREVLIISTRKKSENEIELGFCFSEKGKNIYTINNYSSYSTQAYKFKINELMTVNNN